MKKLCIILIFLLVPLSCSADIYNAADSVDLKSAEALFGSFDFRDMIDNPKEQALTGVFENIVNIFIKDVKGALRGALLVFFVSILYAICSGFEEKSEKMLFLICTVSTAGICAVTFLDMAGLAKSAIENANVFISAAVPSFGIMLAATGNIGTATLCLPILCAAGIGSYIMTYIGIPALFTSFALSMAGGISERFPLKSLATVIRRSAMWLVCGAQTVFCAIMSAGGFASGSLDGAVGKGVKFAASSAIPVLGKILSDATDAVASSSAVIKGTAGAAGILLILAIILYPVLKIAAVIFTYSVMAALCECVSGKKTGALLLEVSDTLKNLVGMMAASGVSSIISLSILIKAGGV